MELYLKVNQPEGKRFFFVDNGKIRKLPNGTRPQVILYPGKPTEVKEADAKHLLEQDPHLVSREAPDFSKPFPTSDAEWKAKCEGLEADIKEALKDCDAYEKVIQGLEAQNEDLQNQLADLKQGLANRPKAGKPEAEAKGGSKK